ncbi:MAG: hypothetical protein RQ751_10100 [Longimicrobiales bacterium]|nr:hypothetical protein [Longimicrobiales bacterium]
MVAVAAQGILQGSTPVAGQVAPGGWRVGEAGRVLGRGPAPTDLFERIADATRLPDGRIAVVDEGLARMVIFPAASGGEAQVVGRRGEGPGEFTRPVSVLDRGEVGLSVFDAALQRLSTFGSDGTLRSDRRVGGLPLPLGMLLRTEEGVWLGRSADRLSRAQLGPLTQDTVAYLWLRDDLSLSGLAWRVPGILIAGATVGGGGQFGFREAPFSPSPTQAAFGRCVVVSPSATGEVLILDPDREEPVRLFDTGRNGAEVTARVWDAWKQDLFQQIPQAAVPEGERVLDALPRPDALPVYRSVKVDPEGFIWLQRYAVPRGYGPIWDVFTPSGEPIVTLDFPAGGQVFEIGTRYVLMAGETALGEPVLRVHPLERPDGRPVVDHACLRDAA